MSLKEQAAEREKAWREYNLSASFLADFVLVELVGNKTNSYILAELFSPKAIESLIAYSVKSVNAFHKGISLRSIGSSAVTRPANEGEVLESLLRSWAEAGWVSIDSEPGTGDFAAQSLLSRSN